MTQGQIKLLLVDDHSVVRLGLASLFETVPSFSVVGQAGSAAEALAEARRCRPDVAIMDVRLPDGSGIEVCRDIRSEHPQCRVIMFTSYSDDDAVVASVLAGAVGYLLKQVPPDRLVEAVQIVAGGGSLLDPAVTAVVLDQMRGVRKHPGSNFEILLSDREERILSLIAEGKTNREIASELYFTESTVRTYVRQIL